MRTVREELNRIQSDTEALVSLSEDHSNVSAELINELGDFRNSINTALSDISTTTETMIVGFQQQLTIFEDKVVRAIAASALLVYKGQKEQAQEISGSILAGSVVGGLFSMLGSTIAGRLISDSITENTANRPLTPDEFKTKALALLLSRMEAERAYISLDEIIQRASNEKDGILSSEETRRLVLVLQADGVLEQAANSTAFRLSRQNPSAIKFLNAYPANKTSSSTSVSSNLQGSGENGRSDFLDLGASFGLTLSYREVSDIESISVYKNSDGKSQVALKFRRTGISSSKELNEEDAEQLRIDTQSKLANFLRPGVQSNQ